MTAKRMTTHHAESSTPKADHRLASLDFLRAVAVLLVIGAHLPFPADDLNPIAAYCIQLLRFKGGLGVDLFFVLSGFLISGLLFREYQKYGQIRFLRFFCRRGLKIYPAFVVLLAFYVLSHLLVSKPVELPRLLAEICFVQNYFLGLWQHTWSLAVEEHFYLLLPWLLILLVYCNRGKANPFRLLPLLFAIAGLAVLALRAWTLFVWPERTAMRHWFPTHLRIDALLFGVLCSYAFHFHSQWFRRTLLRGVIVAPLLGAALLMPYLALSGLPEMFRYTIGLSCFYLGCGLIMSYLLVLNPRGGWGFKGMAWLGFFSYSIYLWHVPVSVGMHSLMERFPHRVPYLVWVGLTYSASVIAGVLMAKLVEYPVLRLRDHFFPSRSGDIVMAPRALEQPPEQRAAVKT
jgi:peptidoglycan/LPS O-acetylase OafA/YrhL